MKHFLPVLALFASVLATVSAQEAPSPALGFDKWVRDTFFNGYRAPSRSQRWDIPATENKEHGSVPVTLKTVKYGNTIDLGDALPQYEIDEPFMLVVGFWQSAGAEKQLVCFAAPVIPPATWHKMWGTVTYADLLRFDALINDQGPSIEEIRRLALKMKSSPPFSDATIQVIPKIETNGQRRLLCSLRFADYFHFLLPGTTPQPQDHPALFGVAYPTGPNESTPSGIKP